MKNCALANFGIGLTCVPKRCALANLEVGLTCVSTVGLRAKSHGNATTVRFGRARKDEGFREKELPSGVLEDCCRRKACLAALKDGAGVTRVEHCESMIDDEMEGSEAVLSLAAVAAVAATAAVSLAEALRPRRVGFSGEPGRLNDGR